MSERERERPFNEALASLLRSGNESDTSQEPRDHTVDPHRAFGGGVGAGQDSVSPCTGQWYRACGGLFQCVSRLCAQSAFTHSGPSPCSDAADSKRNRSAIM